MNHKQFYISIVLLLFTLSSVAQEQDFEIWTEASVQKILNKKISLIAVEEFRFNNNASSFDEWHNTIGVHYAINQTFRARVMYRYSINNTLKKGYQNSNRIIADGIVRYPIKRFILRYRLRYQFDYINIEGLALDGQFLRNQINVKYNIRKTPLMPFLSYEVYYNLHSIYGNSIQRHRFTGGFDYDFSDNFTTRIFYRYQTTSGQYIDARDTYILGFSVGYEF